MNPHSTQINSTTESKSNKRMHLALAVGDANQSLPFDDGYRHSYKSPPPSVQEQVQEQLAQLRANGVPTSAYEAFKLGQKKLREGGAITEAINAFKSGLLFDPNHEECKDGLKVAQQIRDHQTRHVPHAISEPVVSTKPADSLYPSLNELLEENVTTYPTEEDSEEDSEEERLKMFFSAPDEAIQSCDEEIFEDAMETLPPENIDEDKESSNDDGTWSPHDTCEEDMKRSDRQPANMVYLLIAWVLAINCCVFLTIGALVVVVYRAIYRAIKRSYRAIKRSQAIASV